MHKFTIVIPCKNEQCYIGKLLDSILKQTIHPRIIIADGGSTDFTLEIIKQYESRLQIEVIKGGNVSEGRNNGAKLVTTEFVLFIDADMELRDTELLNKINHKIYKDEYDLVTCNIRCHNSLKTDIVYHMNNIGQYLSKLIGSPFSTGSVMCVRKTTFDAIGGFDPTIQFAEDYWLSKQVKRFGIVRGNIYTSNRRFIKSGYFWMIKNFIASYFNRNNINHFRKDFNYWK